MNEKVFKYKNAIGSLKWNAFGSILYQTLLLGHQILLFNVIDKATYGLIGSYFGILFLSAKLMNLGFDVVLGSFYTYWSKNRKQFLYFFLTQTGILYSIFFAFFISYLVGYMIFNLPGNPRLILLSGTIVISEGIKKILRGILQVVFKAKRHALVEIATMVTYALLVWGSYLFFGTITLYSVLVSLAIVTVGSTLVLGQGVYLWFKKLPDSPEFEKISWRRIAKNRGFTYINQFVEQIYSSNFLIPFIAYFSSTEQAGVIKLAGSITYTISVILYKIFGQTSNALFAHLKECSLSMKQWYFSWMHSILQHIIYAVIIFSCINYKVILGMNTSGSSNQLPIIPLIIYIFINLLYNFFTIYERFFTIEERSDIMTTINFGAIICSGLSLCLIPWISFEIILCLLAMIRLGSLILLSFISYALWNIKPSLSINIPFTCSALSISILYFYVF